MSIPGPDEGCPEPWATCLDVDNAIKLERNLRAGRRWMTEAWLRCGTCPDGGTPGCPVGASDGGG